MEEESQQTQMEEYVGQMEVPPPPVILLADILNQQTTTLQKEENDRTILNSLVIPNLDDIRAKLIAWAGQQFQTPCYLMITTLSPPNPCSDGQTRSIFEYIDFLTGNTLDKHISTLQAILPELSVFYVLEGNILKIGLVRR